MKIQSDHVVVAVAAVALVFLLVAVSYGGQANSKQPFPFGTGSPPGCLEYGTVEFQNVSFWYCNTRVNASVTAERTELTFADVNFTAGWVISYGGCPLVEVTGVEIDGAGTILTLPIGAAGFCYFPSPVVLSPDHVFGARWVTWNTVELLVQASPT